MQRKKPLICIPYTELKERITLPSYDRYIYWFSVSSLQSFLKDFRRRKLKATLSRLLHQLKGGEEETWVTCDSYYQMCGHQQASSTWRVFLAPLSSSWVLSTSVSMPGNIISGSFLGLPGLLLKITHPRAASSWGHRWPFFLYFHFLQVLSSPPHPQLLQWFGKPLVTHLNVLPVSD